MLLVILSGYFTDTIFVQNYQYIITDLNQLSGFGIGCCAFGLILLNKQNSLINNYLVFFGIKIHENCHQLLAMILGKKLYGFNVNSKEDEGQIIIEETMNNSSVWILLAPYWFSYSGLSIGLFKFFIGYKWLMFSDIFIGFFWSIHLYLFIIQTRPYQSDLKKVGVFYSFAFIGTMHVIMCNIYIYLLFNQYLE